METFDGWIAAAAVLLKHSKSLHYRSIAEEVVASGIVALGRKGGTPSQTVGAVLRKTVYDGEQVFRREGRGYYSLRNADRIREIPRVERALHYMQGSADQKVIPAHSIDNLHRENTILRMKLEQISRICSGLGGPTTSE